MHYLLTTINRVFKHLSVCFQRRATIVERLAAEQVSGAENKVKKEAINKAKAEVLAAQKVVREAEAAAAEAAARKGTKFEGPLTLVSSSCPLN